MYWCLADETDVVRVRFSADDTVNYQLVAMAGTVAAWLRAEPHDLMDDLLDGRRVPHPDVGAFEPEVVELARALHHQSTAEWTATKVLLVERRSERREPAAPPERRDTHHIVG